MPKPEPGLVWRTKLFSLTMMSCIIPWRFVIAVSGGCCVVFCQ